MNETVKERLIKFLAYEGIAKTKFSESIGADRTYVNSMSNSIQPDKLLKISQLYPQLDIPMDTIAQALGHATPYTTTDIYVNRRLKKIDEANRKVIDFINTSC